MAPGCAHSGGYLTFQKGGWGNTVIVPEAAFWALWSESLWWIQWLEPSVLASHPTPPLNLACTAVLLVSPLERRVKCVPDPTSAVEEPEGGGGGGGGGGCPPSFPPTSQPGLDPERRLPGAPAKFLFFRLSKITFTFVCSLVEPGLAVWGRGGEVTRGWR